MDAKIKKKIGDKLREFREIANLTQAEVANKAEINSNYYARIERGEEQPALDTLYDILKVLKVKSSDILPF